MSDFERIYQTDPSRESDHKREHSSIELTDDTLLLRWVNPTPTVHEEMKKKFQQLQNNQVVNEQIADEKPKRKPAKVPAKSNKTAVARVQKKP